ncbi:MAG: alpha/beta hydrolase [Planctomycetales bacterium]|nr:alpha/beta hydrolase [Planctomycetales bacterium]
MTCLRFGFLFALVLTTQVAHCQSDRPSSVSGANISVNPIGLWEWESGFGGRTRQQQIRLTAETGQLAGTYESPQRGGSQRSSRFGAEPTPLSNIVLEGDKISFDVTRKFGDNDFTTNYAGVISGDEIAGVTVTLFGGQTRESPWMAKRIVEVSGVAIEAQEGDAQVKLAPPQNVETALAAKSDDIPPPMWLPDPGQATESAYSPRAILPGGIVMPLYPENSPYLNHERIKEPETFNVSTSVHGRVNSIVNIHNPSIEIHFASGNMNTGSVVILAAGGGHRTLNVGSESADFVPFFYNYGVNTVILRNRLRSDGYEPTTDAVRDALQAIRLVRKHAEEWKIDPHRIGIMGFSAGAELSAPTAIQFEKFDRDNNDPSDPLAGITSRPDFVGIIYPGPTPFTREPETEIPRKAPPAFITCAGAGDQVHAIWAVDYFSAMLKARIPNVELHIYGNGYHPGDRGSTGGLTHRNGIPFGTWHHRFIEWFDDLGFLTEPGSETKAARDIEEFLSQPPRAGRGPGRGQRPNRGNPAPAEPPQPPASESTSASDGRAASMKSFLGHWNVVFETQVGQQKYDFVIETKEASVNVSATAVMREQPREVNFVDVEHVDDALTFAEILSFGGNEIRIEYSATVNGNNLDIVRKVGQFGSQTATATPAPK